MDHDERCVQQDEQLRAVSERTHALANESLLLRGDVTRVREDVKATAEQVHDATSIIHTHDMTVSRIETELKGLIARIPVSLGADLALMGLQLKTAIADIEALRVLIKADFVHRSEFEPIKRVVYGVVSLILTAVILGLLALVVKK
jgi:hypothetical protein